MKKYIVQIILFFLSRGLVSLLLITYIDSVAKADKEMTVYSYKQEFFQEKRDMTEQKVYEILPVHPIKKNVNYLAVPWVPLFIRNNLQVKLSAKLNSGFTVCQHIEYRKIIPVLRRLGVNVLFTPHATKKQEYKDIAVVPFPLYPTNGADPANKKNILYSFIGLKSHSIRNKIFTLPQKPDTIIKERKRWHFWIVNKRKRKKEKKEYQDVLARSRFSLCPRGTGPSTIRFWESLQAGAIPVLSSDAMALPEIKGINWRDCIIQVPEKNISSVDRIIRAISPKKETHMRKNCLRAYKLSCSGENFVRTIKEYFE